jgi:hypothetical protein
LGDVLRLLLDRDEHPAGRAIQSRAGVVVPDVEDDFADARRDVDIGGARHLPRHHDEAALDQRLAGDAAGRVLSYKSIQYPVRDLVGQLVRVAHRNRLGGEKGSSHRVFLFSRGW